MWPPPSLPEKKEGPFTAIWEMGRGTGRVPGTTRLSSAVVLFTTICAAWQASKNLPPWGVDCLNVSCCLIHASPLWLSSCTGYHSATCTADCPTTGPLRSIDVWSKVAARQLHLHHASVWNCKLEQMLLYRRSFPCQVWETLSHTVFMKAFTSGWSHAYFIPDGQLRN